MAIFERRCASTMPHGLQVLPAISHLGHYWVLVRCTDIGQKVLCTVPSGSFCSDLPRNGLGNSYVLAPGLALQHYRPRGIDFANLPTDN